jgi:UDP-glucose 4-epimerase
MSQPMTANPARVLVTGGAGFIGSHVSDAFLDRGDTVTVADDLSRGQAGRVDPRATLHKVDVRDAQAFSGVVRATRPDIICHLAAQIDVRASTADPAGDAQVNVTGTINVLEAALAVGARVMFASSGGALYGRDSEIPAPEEALTEPESPYGVAKLCAEQYIGLYNRLHGTQHSVLRLANVYGPRQDPAGEAGVIAVFCASVLAGGMPTIYGDGAQTRDYVYVGDVVRAFLAAAGSSRAGTWNVGTSVETTVLDLIRVIGEIADRPVQPQFADRRPGELLRSAVDAGRAARELAWRPLTPLADGMGRVYRWIEAGAAVRAGC